MIRFGLGILVATSACAVVGLAACGDTIKGGGPVPGAGGAANAAGGGANASGGSATGTGATDGGGNVIASKCDGACCPKSAACYSTAAGNGSPGSECLATHDNTDQKHVQMRSTWVRSLTPLGNTSAQVYNSLTSRSELDAPDCNQGFNNDAFGTGGYILLVDFYRGGSLAATGNIDTDFAWTGFAQAVPPGAAALTKLLADGFVFGSETFVPDPGYPSAPLHSADILLTDGPAYPEGLPPPMGALDGWKVGPTKQKRIPEFNLATDRVQILKDLEPTGKYGSLGFRGVFSYNEDTGVMHGYAPVGWVVVEHQNEKTHIAIPIRENESVSKVNDPKRPNCVGAYRGAALDPTLNCKSIDQLNPPWGCLTDAQCKPGEAPATSNGYFLISEIEQVYESQLTATLCVTNPGTDSSGNPIVAAGGFLSADAKSCKGPNWNPKTMKGLPMGDWCSATNKPGDATCHDAWQSKAFQAFSGAKIAGVPDDAATALPVNPYSL